jgi:hypothetical protein
MRERVVGEESDDQRREWTNGEVGIEVAGEWTE